MDIPRSSEISIWGLSLKPTYQTKTPLKVLELDFKSGRPTQRLRVFSQPKGPGSSQWAVWPKNTDILPSDNTQFNLGTKAKYPEE